MAGDPNTVTGFFLEERPLMPLCIAGGHCADDFAQVFGDCRASSVAVGSELVHGVTGGGQG